MSTGIELPCLQMRLSAKPNREALLEFIEQGAQRTIPREHHKPWLFATNPRNVLFLVNLAPAYARLEQPDIITQFVRKFLETHHLGICGFVLEAKLLEEGKPTQSILTVIIQEKDVPGVDMHVYRILGSEPARALGECQTTKNVQTIWKFY